MPNIKQTRKNIQYLTENEIAAIKEVLTTVDSTLSQRDKAIGLLAFYFGIRNSDIAGLTLSDIDWSLDRIHIQQQKTGIPIELPLNAVIGNAIYDYIINERPIIEWRIQVINALSVYNTRNIEEIKINTTATFRS